MKTSNNRYWLLGCGLWILGSVLFLISAVRAKDIEASLGSLAYIIGATLFLIPIAGGSPDD